MRIPRISIRPSFCAALVFAIMGASTSSAPAASPWWHLDSSTRPSYLPPGQAKDEVQQLRVAASVEEYRLRDKGAGLFERTGSGNSVELKGGEEPSLVQTALENEKMYGAGNVEVTGVGKAPFEVYEIKFVGQLKDLPVQPMEVSQELAEQHLAEVRELAKGRPDGEIVLTAVNLGDANANPEAQPVTVSDILPPGLHAFAIEGAADENVSGFGTNSIPVECSLGSLSCTFTGKNPAGSEFTGPYAKFVPPYELNRVRIAVNLTGASSGEANLAMVTGGGAPAATVTQPITVSASPPTFGVSRYEIRPEAEGGGPDTQAGSHPFQLTTTLNLTETFESRPVGLAKDLHFKLPPGLIGNATAVPRCPLAQFLNFHSTTGNQCPAQSVVGVARSTVNVYIPGRHSPTPVHEPVYNLEPAVGEPARFGFVVEAVPVLLTTAVRTGGDYGVTVNATNITQGVEFLSSEVTFWGVPGNEAHNNARGFGCLEVASAAALGEERGSCPAFSQQNPPPLLSLPTSCPGAPLQTTVEADSWAEPHNVLPFSNTAPMPVMDGCNRLPFAPQIKVTPDGQAASTPTGLTVDAHVPQDSILNGNGLSESAVKEISVALPEGVVVNPAGGDGLQACSEGLVGYEPPPASEPPENLHFTPTLPEPFEPGVNFCPDASKIGTVDISSPLLPTGQQLKGFVYLASQNANPFGSLVALYIVAKDPISGVVVKLPGETHLTSTGQVIGTFKNTPQLAFEDAELHFFGGERAPLSSPARCGAYTTNASFTPWSGSEPVNATSTFNITSGPHGSPCPGASLPFSPSLTGGTTNINAGAFSPLTTTIGREDGNQDMQSVQLHMPAGLEGLLSGVKLCPDAQANEGTCGPESQIGETTVSAGVGNDPVTVKGGHVYITEKYAGAPFGLSIVNPVKAGPFDLEHDTSNPSQQPPCDCVVVRAKIEVDPHTADLTITTDQSGPHAIPHMIDGIPVQIKKVNVLVNRPNFTFNPTNCNPLTLTGTIASDEGASSPVSVPFQSTNCAVLKFAPKFTVTTGAHSSKANGASLTFKIAYPPGAMGSESWFQTAKFDIPKQLPARLTTIQKACLGSTFDANPAACPPGSLIGHAIVHTPVLPVPLTGPVYFVSHGGAKFPDAVLVLQGYGINFDLVGETLIKAGVASATFANTPDVPFESIEVTVPSGPTSEFAANLPAKAKGSLCGQKLVMPTRFKAQNGLEIKQNAPIGVTGCAKAKKSTRAQKLAAALKACTKKSESERISCARVARRRYGVAPKKK